VLRSSHVYALLAICSVRRCAVGIILLVGLCALFVHLPVSMPTFIEVKAAYVSSDAYLLDRHGVLIDTLRVDMQVRRLQWTPLQEVSPTLIAMIVDGEDHRFWQHHGVDWHSLGGAVRDQLMAHQRRGASTITMQLASLLLHQGHAATGFNAVRRKLSQMRLSWALERKWNKQQILEAYLNLVTFHGELQGIAATAQQLSGKSPAGLSLADSIVLASMLPSPNAMPEKVAARACRRAVLHHLTVTCNQLQQAAMVLLRQSNAPDDQGLAPHAAQLLLNKPGQTIRTTLDADIQRIATESLRARLADLSAHNVRDGAVLVVNNDTGEVLAYVGSASRSSLSQQVDGVRAYRQAGSTLKPFLYELAIEHGYLTTASLLSDSPLNLDTASGTYIPQDYDHEYKGLVSVRTALGSSLNVPAVRTLVLTGVDSFRDRLHELGYAGITRDGNYYGYSLALGSAEVSLWEQAQAYRALARQGQWLSLTLQSANNVAPRTVLPAAPAFIIADVLSDRAARALTFGFDNHLNTAFWSAAKTGTSKDMRDNWCIGFSEKYTVAVWVGNFEGDAMHDVSGVTGAAPVWQDIMLALHQNQSSFPPAPPAGVKSMTTRFSSNVEPSRNEWFMSNVVLPEVAATTARGDIVHIESPSNGVIIAVDPDIPAANQRMPIIVRGATTDMIIKLDDKVLGSATRQLLWSPRPGAYHLSVEDSQHQVIDRVLFTVR
jgi:penicillin-binding protein 1C